MGKRKSSRSSISKRNTRKNNKLSKRRNSKRNKLSKRRNSKRNKLSKRNTRKNNKLSKRNTRKNNKLSKRRNSKRNKRTYKGGSGSAVRDFTSDAEYYAGQAMDAASGAAAQAGEAWEKIKEKQYQQRLADTRQEIFEANAEWQELNRMRRNISGKYSPNQVKSAPGQMRILESRMIQEEMDRREESEDLSRAEQDAVVDAQWNDNNKEEHYHDLLRLSREDPNPKRDAELKKVADKRRARHLKLADQRGTRKEEAQAYDKAEKAEVRKYDDIIRRQTLEDDINKVMDAPLDWADLLVALRDNSSNKTMMTKEEATKLWEENSPHALAEKMFEIEDAPVREENRKKKKEATAAAKIQGVVRGKNYRAAAVKDKEVQVILKNPYGYTENLKLIRGDSGDSGEMTLAEAEEIYEMKKFEAEQDARGLTAPPPIDAPPVISDDDTPPE